MSRHHFVMMMEKQLWLLEKLRSQKTHVCILVMSEYSKLYMTRDWMLGVSLIALYFLREGKGLIQMNARVVIWMATFSLLLGMTN